MTDRFEVEFVLHGFLENGAENLSVQRRVHFVPRVGEIIDLDIIPDDAPGAEEEFFPEFSDTFTRFVVEKIEYIDLEGRIDPLVYLLPVPKQVEP